VVEVGVAVQEQQAVAAGPAAQREQAAQEDRAVPAQHEGKAPGVVDRGDGIGQRVE
jgi:hypothetical protein